MYHFEYYPWLKRKSNNDFTNHIIFAMEMAKSYTATVQIPHPLYHFILNLLTGFSANLFLLKIAAICTLTVAILLKAKLSSLIGDFLLEKNGVKLTNGQKIFFLLTLVFVSPVKNWWNSSIYLGQFTANVWHNPTTIMLMPFSLAVLYFFLKRKTLGMKASLYGGILLGLSALLKPNFAIIILPFLFLLFVFKKLLFRELIIFSLFSGIILTGQIFFLNDDVDSGITFLPMYVWRGYTPNPMGSILVSFAFPFVMTLLLFRKELKDPHLVLFAWILVFIALGQFILLAEEGERILHGNFYWGIIPSLYFLFLVLMVELIIITKNSRNIHRIKCAICYFLLILHLFSGILYFIRTLEGRNIFA